MDNVIGLNGKPITTPANDADAGKSACVDLLTRLLEDARKGEIDAVCGVLFTRNGIGHFSGGSLSLCSAVGGLEYAKMAMMTGSEDEGE